MTEGWSQWPAPAKLNLFLHITGRRPDGYHLLQTVFQLLDWGDTVRLRVRPDGVISRSRDLPGVAAEHDLTLRAANLLRARAGIALGAEIDVDKAIPLGAGLGGGSSDAATVLVALNELWGAGLSADMLADIGLSLGADVPVFIHGHSAWADNIRLPCRNLHGQCLRVGGARALPAGRRRPRLARPIRRSAALGQRWLCVCGNGFGGFGRSSYSRLSARVRCVSRERRKSFTVAGYTGPLSQRDAQELNVGT